MSDTIIRFTVRGTPKAQPRPRAFARKFGDKYQARVYDAGTAEGWKSEIALAARYVLPAAPLTGPLRIDVDFIFPRPGRLNRKCDPPGRVMHTSKPDRDNCDKALLDALKTIGMFADDAQVCAGEPRKWYAAKGEVPGAQVSITILETQQSQMPLLAAGGSQC